MNHLFHNLLLFSRLLRGLGLEVQAARTLDVAQALEHVKVGRKTEFYHALRTLLVHRHQDLLLFDEAFNYFWRKPRDRKTTGDVRHQGRQRRRGAPEFGAVLPDSRELSRDMPDPKPIFQIDRVRALSYSPKEMLSAKDFAKFTSEEISEVTEMMTKLKWKLSPRQTRRWTAGPGTSFDLRRVVRQNLRYGGELIHVPRRQRREKRRPLVLICDVSGSMENYTRMLLQFVFCVTRGSDRVEVFLFSTRLTRITKHLSSNDMEQAVKEIRSSVIDWGGGTRIGEIIRTFNLRWSGRMLEHGPIVLFISDGWDRGDPKLLGDEISRLQRSCHRLIWLNPLLGSSEYTPIARGMQAALPFVDDFLPVHNLRSLEALAKHLNDISTIRPNRRQQASEFLGRLNNPESEMKH